MFTLLNKTLYVVFFQFLCLSTLMTQNGYYKVHSYPTSVGSSDEGFRVYIKEFEQEQNYMVKVYNHLGNLIHYGKISQGLTNITTDWHSGIYFVEISKDGQHLLKEKLIKL